MNNKIFPKISEVLHYAADHCLAYKTRTPYLERFSCCAIDRALSKLIGEATGAGLLRTHILDGISKMGCGIYSCHLFVPYGDDPMKYEYINTDVQGMRYMWLKWAALMAEEQGQ